jgi:hypothetical protein
MSLLGRLENRFRRFAVPNVTLALIAGQIVIYALTYFGAGANPPPGGLPLGQQLLNRLELIPDAVIKGEVWRVVTFVFVPPIDNVIFAFFFWYLFYLMGTALEHTWGAFRYNIYLLIGYIATVAASFILPQMPATNAFVQSSVFLAFAQLYPDFLLSIFFVVPVKIKWFALLTWIGYVFLLIVGDWTIRVMILASIANFLLFFSRDIKSRISSSHRRMMWQANRAAAPAFRVHCCAVCGTTSEDDRTMEFRYCSKCHGNLCYCSAHLRNHPHVEEEAEQAQG